MDIDTEGRRALLRYLEQHKRNPSWLARELGIAQPSARAWVVGKARPDHDMREAIHLLTGVPAESWRTPAERERLAEVRARIEQRTAEVAA